MQTSPSGPCSSLSMPLGPSDDLRILAIALADLMWALCASIPLIRCFFSCSCTITVIGLHHCYSVNSCDD